MQTRLPIKRILRAVAVAASLAAVPCAPASAAPDLLVDLSDGSVLYAREADRSWRPASLTKLMTAHLALKAVADGRLNADSPVTVSARAAAEPPSKLGLPAGRSLPLSRALSVLMVKSANDLATAVAETVSGNSESFVREMNLEATRLGMSGTNFVNAHGLDSPLQVTTARDVAVLYGAIARAHPRHAGMFALPTATAAGQTFRNTNTLLGKYPGIDGGKTGYVCASGFNIATSATRNGRRLLAVVMGAANARTREARVRNLLDAGFEGRLPATGSLDALRRAVPVTAADLRQSNCGRDGDRSLPRIVAAAPGAPSDLPPDLAAALLAIGGTSPEPVTPYGAPDAARLVPVPVPAPRSASPPPVAALPVPAVTTPTDAAARPAVAVPATVRRF